MVVHEPGPWFDEVLTGLARQDYANLRSLFLVVGEVGDLPAQIRSIVPHAFVRGVEGNPGFGAVADEVLRLVEGDNGFFCILHDDVALEPDAIRLLVEELYRSNAGIVGPKLVEWDRPRVLQHVGLAVDRFGEVDPLVEPGEVDQEQHDAVRDVFALPSACLLVRADLFRHLDGFDPAISFHGEDIDLCWRAHQRGARVVVVPSARARHREELTERRPDLAHETLRARHRMRSVATLSGGRRLVGLSVELTLVTLVELVVGFFTGRGRRGVAGMRALLGLLPRTPSIIGRRRRLAPGRVVPDREVTGLQLRGSARFATYLRGRDVRGDAFRAEQRSWRERAGASGAVAWIVLLIAVFLGSRQFITDGLPTVGQFLPYDASPRHLLRLARSGWWSHGGGAATTAPTGLFVLAAASVVTLFRMGLLHTLGVVGLLVLGPLGVWRLSASFATNRSRLATLFVYAAVPLPAQLVSLGRWSALGCYAALPWFVDGLRRFAGLTAGAPTEEHERVTSLPVRRQIQLVASTAVVTALTLSFAPGFVAIAPVVVVLLAAATFAGGARWTAGLRLLLGGLGAVALGILLVLPWFAGFIGDGGWGAIVGAPTDGGRGNTLAQLARFDIGSIRGTLPALALYLPVVAAPLLGRGWRFGWAARAGVLVAGFGWLAWLDERGRLPLRLPEPGIVLGPVALGLALAAGAAVAAFELDVRGGSFGWRQPLGILSGFAIVVGLVPGLFGISSGRYETPEITMLDLLDLLPDQDAAGGYRVLWLGDQDLLPVAGQPFRNGVGYALTDGERLDVTELWAGRPTELDQSIRGALDAIAAGTTTRAGRLLAPASVRFVVIPVIDGAVSPADSPLPLPSGLLDALGDQLDLGAVYSPTNFIVYENQAWIPMRSVLSAEGAAASKQAGAAALADADVSGAVTIMDGADQLVPGAAAVPAGTVHLAVPFDRGWHLTVDGTELDGRPAFGTTLAWDVTQPGTAVLEYRTSASHTAVLVAQLVGWVVVLLAASGLRPPRRRVSSDLALLGDAGPVLSMDDGTHPVLDPSGAIRDPGLALLATPEPDDAEPAAEPGDAEADAAPGDGETDVADAGDTGAHDADAPVVAQTGEITDGDGTAGVGGVPS